MENDPWSKYNQVNNKVTQATSSNPWDLYTSSQQQEDSGGPLQDSFNKIVNRTRNIGKIIGSGISIALGNTVTPNQAELLKELSKGQEAATQGNVMAGHDITNMFDNVNVKDTIKSMWNTVKGGVGALAADPTDALNKSARTILELPGNIVESVVGDTFGSITGVDLDGSEVKALTPEVHAAKTKAMIGNAVAAIVAPAASKMVQAGFELSAASKLGGTALSGAAIDAATTPQLAALYTQKSIGALGRAITDDVVAGAASGIAQGAITNANSPETLSAMATGLLFAPIGVLTGWYRGVGVSGDAIETAMTRAHDVKLLRDWQEIGDANVMGAAKKVENLISSDNIEQALAIDISKPKIKVLDYKFDKVPPTPKTEPLVVEPTIENLYNDFEKTLNNTDSFASSFVTYTQRKNLGDFSNELLEKFARMFVEKNVDSQELSHIRMILKNNREFQNGKFLLDREEMVGLANQKGFFLTNEHGRLAIRDIESGDVLEYAHTSKEAMTLMNEMGEPANVTNMDSGAKIPSIGTPPPPVTPALSTHPGDDWEPVRTNLTAKVAGFELKMNAITAMNGFVEAVDRLFDTNLKHQVFEPIERSARLTKVAIDNDLNSGQIKLIDAFVRSGKSDTGMGFAGRFTTDHLEWVGKAMEAQSWDEMIAPGGYAKNFTVSKEAQDLAKYMHDNNIDASKVLYYRRAMAATKYQHMLEAQQTAAKNLDFNETHGMPGEDAYTIYNQEKASYEKSPAYVAAQQKIATFFSPDQNFLKASEMYDKIFTMPDGSAHAGAASRLKLALDQPDIYGLSQAEFIKKHNLNSDQVRLLGMLQKAYDDFGNKFGIDDSRKFMRYMNHYRQYGDILDSFVVGDFERGIQDGAMRQFASAMIRTGEVSNYSMNPVSNLYSYIRAGNKSQIVYRELEERLNKLEATIGPELNKITDPVVRRMAEERFNSYQRDITGQTSMTDTEAMHAKAHVLKNLIVDENGNRMTAEDIIKEMNKPDHIDTIMSLSSAGLLGGRVSLAMRDNYDVWQKFYIKHGAKRLSNLLRTRVSDKLIETLVDRGDITKPDALDIYNVTHSQGTAGALGAAAKEIAEFGFKTSLQGHYYMKNQAAVWLETVKNTNEVLATLSKGDLSKKAAYDKIFLNSFDIPTQKMFDAYVSDGQFEAASRLLASQEVRATVGTFARGNQAPILNSKLGKLFGQLGSWSMTNRSVFENLMTRGTKQEIARSMTRYATTIAATQLAGAATGLNLGRWLLLPTSLVTTGGPILQAIQSGGGLAAAELGGNEAQVKYARRQAQRSMQQFIPGSYMINDIKDAAKLATEGSNYGPGRIAAQALGVSVNEQDRTFLDIVQGNYPIPPQ